MKYPTESLENGYSSLKRELDEWILNSSSHHRTTEDMVNEYLLKNKRKRF